MDDAGSVDLKILGVLLAGMSIMTIRLVVCAGFCVAHAII
jgi:hypothetical protein